MATSGDAVATGSTILNPEVLTKRLELAKEALPTATQMGFLFNSANSSDRLLLETAEQTAEDFKLKIVPLAVKSSDDISATISRLGGRLDALIVTEDGVVISNAHTASSARRPRPTPSIPACVS